MFSPLDKSKVRTGYLLDQSPDYVNMSLYDGTALVDSNYVDIGIFGDFFRSLNGAKVGTSSAYYNANNIVSDLQSDTPVKLGAALFEYNYIVSNALQDNLISYTGGKVYDVYSNGVWRDPYRQRYVCMLTTGTLSFNSLSVPFSFDSEDNFWRTIDPTYIRIDFGDGGGFVNVSSGFSGTINYSDYGTKEIKLAVELEDETVLLSHTYLNVTAPPVDALAAGLHYDWPDDYHVSYDDKTLSASVSCKYAPTHSKLIRPLIFVEGFDYAILPNSFASLLSNNNPGNSQNYASFIEDYYQSDSLKNKYDAIYVDLWNPLEDIRANAALLESIILDVNTQKHQSGSSERNVVVGHSMGGLIARYALACMEQSIPVRLHETDYYVSYDSPHLGANIPIGAQYAVRDIVNCFYQDGYSSTPFGLLVQWLVNRVTTAFNSTAARQMSYHWISPNGVEDNSVHTVWQETLNQIGFPKGDKGHPIENLSIVNGNIIGASILGRPILDATLDANYAVPNILYNLQTLGLYTNVNVRATIKRRKGESSNNVSCVKVRYSKHFPWLDNHPFIDSYLLNIQHPDTPSSVYYDLVPSSTISLDQYTASFLGSSFSMASSLVLGFIPSASAICVPDYSQSRNFYTNQPEPITVSPFSSHFIWHSPQHHGLVFHWHCEWLSDMTRMKLNGPSILKDGDSFSIVNDADSYNGQWSLTGTPYHSINSNGNVSVTDSLPAVVNISYYSEKKYSVTDSMNVHQILYKHKRVLAGFPRDFHLTKTSSGANTFNLYASCSNEEINAFLDTLAAGGSITYWWGEKTGDANIQWAASTSRSYAVSPLAVTNVYFKITDGLGREYGLRSDQIIPDIPSSLTVNYDPSVIYTMWGNTYMYYNVIDDPGLLTSYFMMWDKLSLTPPPAPDRIVINGQTIMRDVIMTETVSGESKSVYCFNILGSTYLQSVISNINSYPGNTAFVSGSVFSGSTWIQDFTITVRKGFPPLN